MRGQPALNPQLPADGSFKSHTEYLAIGGIRYQIGVVLDQFVDLSQAFSLHGNRAMPHGGVLALQSCPFRW
jgi:hypothetical protein